MSLHVINRAFRPHPVKAFFKSPTLHRVLKVTAIALATLAVLAGIALASFFIATPILTLLLPVCVIGTALAILVGKKSKPLIPRSEEAAPPADDQMRQSRERQLEEAKSSYRELLDPFGARFNTLINTLKNNSERIIPVLNHTQAFLDSLDQSIELQKTMGIELNLMEIEEHKSLVQNLRTLSQEIDTALESGGSANFINASFSLKAAISQFLEKHC